MIPSKRNEALAILERGELLQAMEQIAYTENNNDEWHRRCARALALVLAGQCLRRAKDGTRLYSHLGLYQPKGMGRGHFLRWIDSTKAIPKPYFDGEQKQINGFSIVSLDAASDAALASSVTTEGTIKPSVLVRNDIVKVEEFATLMAPGNEGLMSNVRRILEDGNFTRDLLKLMRFREILKDAERAEKQLSTTKKLTDRQILELAKVVDRGEMLKKDLEKWRKRGLSIDIEEGRMSLRSHASWIISSARFGDTSRTKPLLDLGDLDRYVWVSNIPSLAERKAIIRKVGFNPVPEKCEYDPEAVNEAWSLLFNVTGKFRLKSQSIELPRSEELSEKMVSYWDATERSLLEEFTEVITERHQEEFNTLRYMDEFKRVALQHATLMQFKRDSSFGLTPTLVIDYDEDFAFARDVFLSEYIPSFIEVMNDVQRTWPVPELQKRAREKRLQEQLTLVLRGYKQLGRNDVLAIELHDVMQRQGFSKQYMSFWRLVKKAVAIGLVEHHPAVSGQQARVTLTKKGVKKLAELQ